MTARDLSQPVDSARRDRPGRPSRRRTRSRSRAGHRARLTVALVGTGVVVAALATPASAAAAPSPAAPAPAAVPFATQPPPVVTSSETVGGVPDGTVPAPPADALGTPAASTMVQADDLQLTGIDRPAGGAQAINDYWTSPGYNKAADLGGPGGDSEHAILNPNYPTASGRFRDPDSDRTMSFRMTQDGSNSILQLASNTFTVEPAWQNADQPCQLTPGSTCAIETEFSSALTEASTERGFGFYDFGGPNLDQPLHPGTTQLWTAVDVGDPDGYLQLVNKSDGLCLAAFGETVGSTVATQPCVQAGAQLGDQLWKATPGKDAGWIKLVVKSSGLQMAENPQQPGPAAVLEPVDYDMEFALKSVSEPGGMIPTWSTEIPGTNPAVPMALATGDLDRVVGSDNNYHDEAVVAWADPTTHQLQVRVIDYNDNASHLLATAPTLAAGQAMPTVGKVDGGGTWFPGSVGVAVGDFGLAGEEALNEIAVTWQDASGNFHLTMLKYRATATGGRTLTVIGDPAGNTLFTADTGYEPGSLASGFAQTVAGDFAGDGTAEVAIAWAAQGTSDPGFLSGHLGVVGLDSSLTKVTGESSSQFSDWTLAYPPNAPAGGATWTPQGLRLASGYFNDDAADGHTFQRRELALVWNEPGRDHGVDNRGVAVYDVTQSADPDCTPATCLSVSAQIGPDYGVSSLPTDRPIPMAVGGFEGVGTGADAPLWDIAIWSTDGQHSVLRVIQPDPGNEKSFRSSDTSFGITDSTQMVLTAYDRDGASLVLGAPLVATTTVVKPILIAAQPPTQADWIGGRWVNVSRVGDFSVTMGSETKQDYNSTYTTTASQSDGVTQSADIKASLRYGTKDDNITGSAELKEKFAKNWTSSSEQFTKYSTTIEEHVSDTARDDDIVQTDLQTVTLYRYPILNRQGTEPDGTVVYPFYQVTVPGQVVQDDGAGKDLSFYQPSWENGNALSYPKLVDDQVQIPGDLGSYSYVDATGATQQKDAPLLDKTNHVGGTSATDNLAISTSTKTGSTSTSGWNLKTSVQLTATASFTAEIGTWKPSGSVSLSLGYNGARAAGSSNVGTSTASQGTSLELNVPVIDSNASYRIGTAYYYDDTGTPKVIEGDDLTSNVNSNPFWEGYYGQQPDPGLLLPDASFLTYDQYGNLISPMFSTTATRQLIRGFAALQPYDANSPMTSGQPYGTDPEAGDPVTFAVQVHDFSLVDSPSVPVQFYAVPVDGNNLNVTGPPQPIGTPVQSGTIPSQGYVTVDSPTWSAKGSGDATDLQNWRIFVVVDPDNSVKDPNGGTGEIHPWKATASDPVCPADALDPKAPPGTIVGGKMVDPMTGGPDTLSCDQNNQGYGMITVMPKSLGAALGSGPAPKVTLAAAGFATGAGSTGGGLGATRPGTLAVQMSPLSHDPTLELEQDATGIIQTATTASTAAIQPLLVYDGPPSDGRLIASTTMNGATRADGGTAQFSWRPTTAGMHTLYLVLPGSTAAANSVQTMQVDVAAPAAATIGAPQPKPGAPAPSAQPSTAPAVAALPGQTPAPTTSSALPPFSLLPGATGDAAPAPPGPDRTGWAWGGLAVVLCGVAILWMRRRRARRRRA